MLSSGNRELVKWDGSVQVKREEGCSGVEEWSGSMFVFVCFSRRMFLLLSLPSWVIRTHVLPLHVLFICVCVKAHWLAGLRKYLDVTSVI